MHVIMMMMMMRGVTFVQVTRSRKKKRLSHRGRKCSMGVWGSDRIGEIRGTEGIRHDAHSPVDPKRSPPRPKPGVMTNFM